MIVGLNPNSMRLWFVKHEQSNAPDPCVQPVCLMDHGLLLMQRTENVSIFNYNISGCKTVFIH